MKPPVTTRKLTTLSLLAAIALALYAVESALPPIVPIPGIKLGLSNIITLVVLWKYSAKDAFFVLLVRILLATMFFGQAMSLLYSLSGGILCLFAMLLVKRLLHGNYLFLASMTGAVFHNLGQIGSGVSADFRSRRACLSAVFASQRSGDRSVHWSLCPLYASLPSVISTGSSASICATVL